MGLLLLVIYIPALLLVSIVSYRLAANRLRNCPVSNIAPVKKVLFYLLGAALAITATSLVAWWYSELTSAEWDRLFRWVGISLVGPLIVGLLLSAFTASQKRSSLNCFLVAGVFHSTLAMPFAGLGVAVFYDDFTYRPAFDRLCANARPVFLEKVAPAKSFALLSWWLDGSERGGTGLLLAHDTPLIYVDVKAAGDGKGIRYTALPPERRQSSARVLGWRGVFSDVEVERPFAEYVIEATEQQISSSVPGSQAINAYRVEIRRSSDRKVIAFSDVYSHRGQNWECPAGVSNGSFAANFIATALELPKR